jgi:hypothetical protein
MRPNLERLETRCSPALLLNQLPVTNYDPTWSSNPSDGSGGWNVYEPQPAVPMTSSATTDATMTAIAAELPTPLTTAPSGPVNITATQPAAPAPAPVPQLTTPPPQILPAAILLPVNVPAAS